MVITTLHHLHNDPVRSVAALCWNWLSSSRFWPPSLLHNTMSQEKGCDASCHCSDLELRGGGLDRISPKLSAGRFGDCLGDCCFAGHASHLAVLFFAASPPLPSHNLTPQERVPIAINHLATNPIYCSWRNIAGYLSSPRQPKFPFHWVSFLGVI